LTIQQSHIEKSELREETLCRCFVQYKSMQWEIQSFFKWILLINKICIICRLLRAVHIMEAALNRRSRKYSTTSNRIWRSNWIKISFQIDFLTCWRIFQHYIIDLTWIHFLKRNILYTYMYLQYIKLLRLKIVIEFISDINLVKMKTKNSHLPRKSPIFGISMSRWKLFFRFL
jgi:hypothetical protein